jgi:hypothetical protein
MLKTRKRKLIALCAGALSILTVGAAVAVAASEDTWAKGANTAWAASSSLTQFQVLGLIGNHCTSNTAGGTSVGAGPDNPPLAAKAPQFNNCTDTAGQEDDVTTIAAGWKVQFQSDKKNAKCPGGAGSDETSGADCVAITVPKNAATVLFGGLGDCKLTVQPNGPTIVYASVSDPGGTTKNTFTLTNQPLQVSGCGAGGSATFSGTYTLSAPNGGVLVDNS